MYIHTYNTCTEWKYMFTLVSVEFYYILRDKLISCRSANSSEMAKVTVQKPDHCMLN